MCVCLSRGASLTFRSLMYIYPYIYLIYIYIYICTYNLRLLRMLLNQYVVWRRTASGGPFHPHFHRSHLWFCGAIGRQSAASSRGNPAPIAFEQYYCEAVFVYIKRLDTSLHIGIYLIPDITLQGISSYNSTLKNKFSFGWWHLPTAWRNKLSSQPGALWSSHKELWQKITIQGIHVLSLKMGLCANLRINENDLKPLWFCGSIGRQSAASSRGYSSPNRVWTIFLRNGFCIHKTAFIVYCWVCLGFL
jgi:hypothetical protein